MHYLMQRDRRRTWKARDDGRLALDEQTSRLAEQVAGSKVRRSMRMEHAHDSDAPF